MLCCGKDEWRLRGFMQIMLKVLDTGFKCTCEYLGGQTQEGRESLTWWGEKDKSRLQRIYADYKASVAYEVQLQV